MTELLRTRTRQRLALWFAACAIAAVPLFMGTAMAQDPMEGGPKWVEVTPNGVNCNPGCTVHEVCC